MEFRILGPLEVETQDGPLKLGPAKQRALLAVLLLHRNQVVATDRLVDEMWGEQPPQTATKTVQVYVSNLRKALGDGVLETQGRGYLLRVGPGQVDADLFEELAQEGRRVLEADPKSARRSFEEALALWRGHEAFERHETPTPAELYEELQGGPDLSMVYTPSAPAPAEGAAPAPEPARA